MKEPMVLKPVLFDFSIYLRAMVIYQNLLFEVLRTAVKWVYTQVWNGWYDCTTLSNPFAENSAHTFMITGLSLN
jgi:hypothetical protein